jgi:hypothetical protein
MKSLYESILDDEDVLIVNTKKFINNPLRLFHSLYKQYGDLTKAPQQDIIDVLSKLDFPDFKDLTMRVYKGHVSFSANGDVIFRVSCEHDIRDTGGEIVKILLNSVKRVINIWIGSAANTKKYKKKLIDDFNMKEVASWVFYYYI